MTLKDLAVACRKSGLTVVELPGWQTRGRPASTGGFDPRGVLCHHTGGASNSREYAEWMTLTGRSDLPAPLCQLALDRNGIVYVCAAGRANHGGKARATGPMPAGDANSLYVGIEAMNTGSEGWTATQYDAYVRLCAALCEHYGWPTSHVRAHRETSSTGKWDPGGIDMDKFRTNIKKARRPKPKPPAAVHREARAHISLKHSLDATLIGRYVAAVVKEDDCTSFTTTESSRAYRRAIKQRLGDKWIVRKSGEYIIGIRRDTFKPLASRLPVLTRLSKVYAGRQEWRDFFVSRRLYVHRATGRLYAPSAGHAPSGVQNGDYWKVANWRGVKASKRGLTRLGVWATRVQRNRAGVVVALGIDTNLDHHRVAWRRRVSDRLGLASMWDRTRPASNVGTHGSRLIDVIYSNAPMTDPRISSVRRPRGVDHKAVVVDLHFTPIAPNQKEHRR